MLQCTNLRHTAWQDYNGIFESLTDLLEKCIDFLDRLSNYAKTHMDAKLRRVACLQLSLFIDICDRALQLRHSMRFKVAAMAKVLFLKDTGIQDFLARMKRLNEQELSLVSSQTLLVATKVEKSVDAILTSVDPTK